MCPSSKVTPADGSAFPAPPANHEDGDGVLGWITIKAVDSGTNTSHFTIPSTLGGADTVPHTIVTAGDGPLAGTPMPTTALQSSQVVIDGSCTISFDSDSDGLVDRAGDFVCADPADACADTESADDEVDDKWSADFDDNWVVNVADLFRVLPPSLVSVTGASGYSASLDLKPDGVTNIGDLFKVLPVVFGQRR